MRFLKRIYQTIVNIPKDKLLHFTVGLLLGLLLNLFITYEWALFIVLIVAIGKEIIIDYLLGKGTAEIADGFATFIGGFTAIWISQILIFS